MKAAAYTRYGPPDVVQIMEHMVAAPVLSRFVSQRLLTFIAKMNKEDLTIICELMAAGKVKPVIDKHYRLSEAAEALGYLEKGHARGKVIIDLGSATKA